MQAQKWAEVKEMIGAEVKKEEELEGEALVGPEGEALRPPGITMVPSQTHFFTFFVNITVQQCPDNFFLYKGALLIIRQAGRR